MSKNTLTLQLRALWGTKLMVEKRVDTKSTVKVTENGYDFMHDTARMAEETVPYNFHAFVCDI